MKTKELNMIQLYRIGYSCLIYVSSFVQVILMMQLEIQSLDSLIDSYGFQQ